MTPIVMALSYSGERAGEGEIGEGEGQTSACPVPDFEEMDGESKILLND